MAGISSRGHSGSLCQPPIITNRPTGLWVPSAICASRPSLLVHWEHASIRLKRWADEACNILKFRKTTDKPKEPVRTRQNTGEHPNSTLIRFLRLSVVAEPVWLGIKIAGDKKKNKRRLLWPFWAETLNVFHMQQAGRKPACLWSLRLAVCQSPGCDAVPDQAKALGARNKHAHVRRAEKCANHSH